MVHVGRRSTFDADRALRTATAIRAFELAQVALWEFGLVPGELHSSIGEEGIAAGVVLHLRGGDAMAIDHRSTGPLLARGADPAELLLDVLGAQEGPSRGWAGHMHLSSPPLLAAADGIVGSSGPIATGFAVAATRLRPGTVAVAFFGEGAANQGMLLESWNLAAAWQLPVLFVCKDSRWSITTRTAAVTGGDLVDRARGFGLTATRVDGWRTDRVHAAAGRLLDRARAGRGPGLLLARCHRPRGHFEGDPLVDLVTHPVTEAPDVLRPVARGAVTRGGGSVGDRTRALTGLTARVGRYLADEAFGRRDPVSILWRQHDDQVVAHRAQASAITTIRDGVRAALDTAGVDPAVTAEVLTAQEAARCAP